MHTGKKLFQMHDLADKRYESMMYIFQLCYRVIQHSQDSYRKNQVRVEGHVIVWIDHVIFESVMWSTS